MWPGIWKRLGTSVVNGITWLNSNRIQVNNTDTENNDEEEYKIITNWELEILYNWI